MDRQAEDERLRELVRSHRVCFECSQDYSAYTGELQAVGFLVEVYATYDAPTHHPSPGCDLCAPVEEALRDIVEHVLPKARARSTTFSVELPHTISYDSRRHARPDRSASIEILHRSGVNDPVDECERRCRDEIVARLEALGACEKSWQGAPT
jgi:hypothetical protein